MEEIIKPFPIEAFPDFLLYSVIVIFIIAFIAFILSFFLRKH